MIAALEAEGAGWTVAVQSGSHAGIFAAVRAGVAVTSVAAGTAPPDLEEVASDAGLPALPRVPVYLVTTPHLRPAARRMAEALQAVLSEMAV